VSTGAFTLRFRLLLRGSCGQWFCPGVTEGSPGFFGQPFPQALASTSNRSAAVSTLSQACTLKANSPPRNSGPRSTIPGDLINGRPRRQGTRSAAALARRLGGRQYRLRPIRARAADAQTLRPQPAGLAGVPGQLYRLSDAPHEARFLEMPGARAVGTLSVCSAAWLGLAPSQRHSSEYAPATAMAARVQRARAGRIGVSAVSGLAQ